MIDTERLCHMNQRSFGGISDNLSFPVRIQTCVIAQSSGADQFLIHFRMLFCSVLYRSGLCRLEISIDSDVRYGHFI